MTLESTIDEEKYKSILAIGDIAAGKETFTLKFESEFSYEGQTAVAFSSGERLRLIDRSTPLGKIIGPIIDSANLVPDELLMEFVKDEISKLECNGKFNRKNNYLFADGVVRTQPQIELFEKFAKVYAVLNLSIPIEVADDRARIRYETMLAAYLKDPINNPKPRPEDATRKLRRERYINLSEKVQPVKDYYGNKGLLVTIDATKPKEEVYDSAIKALLPYLTK